MQISGRKVWREDYEPFVEYCFVNGCEEVGHAEYHLEGIWSKTRMILCKDHDTEEVYRDELLKMAKEASDGE